MIKKYLFLIIILLLAAVLRFYQLGSNPVSLTWDEAALGYNAYSLLLTGKDEYGTLLPLQLKSFGDYKPALYSYVDVPFVAVFGLNELAVRLPSAIAGVLTVLLTYLIIIKLFNNKIFGNLATLLLALSPWSLQFSRGAWEANLALFLITLGVWLFLKGLDKDKFLPWSAAVFGLTLFTYQSARLFTPLLGLGLLIIYISRRQLRLSKNLIIGGGIFGFFVVVLAVLVIGGGGKRLSTLNFFAYTRSPQQVAQISQEDGLPENSWQFQVLHGEWWAYTRGLFERYLIYFSPRMLFIDGDYDYRQRVPDLGALSYYSVIFIPLGIFYLLRHKRRESVIIFVWLLLAPIPAVLSRDLISTLRALNMVVPWSILEGAGGYLIYSLIRDKTLAFRVVSGVMIAVIVGFNFLLYLDSYYVHAPKEYSVYWMYPYKQVFQEFGQTFNHYNKVVVSDYYDEPYIYYLFYTKYPPAKFQKQAVLDQPGVDVGTVRKIDNIEFRPIYWPNDRGISNSLFIGTIYQLPDQDVLPFPQFSLLKDIKLLDGQIGLRVVETK